MGIHIVLVVWICSTRYSNYLISKCFMWNYVFTHISVCLCDMYGVIWVWRVSNNFRVFCSSHPYWWLYCVVFKCLLEFNYRLYKTISIYMRVSLFGLFARRTKSRYGRKLDDNSLLILDCVLYMFNFHYRLLHVLTLFQISGRNFFKEGRM